MITIRRWKYVDGYNGRYQVSDDGLVWSNITNRILKPGISIHGYGRVVLCKNELEKKNLPVHRLVAIAFIGESDLQVDHIDGNKLNNRVENLRYINARKNSSYGKLMYEKTSKYTGVSKNKTQTKWRATIKVGKKYEHLGYFYDELQAAIAYKIAETEIENGIHPTKRHAI